MASEESGINELLSISFLLDIDAKQVAKALDAAFLHGEPGRLDDATLAGLPTDDELAQQKLPEMFPQDMVVKRDYVVPMPYPVAPEWEEHAQFRVRAVDPKMIWYGAFTTCCYSPSFGLRPLHPGERVAVRAQSRSCETELLNSACSHIRRVDDGGMGDQLQSGVRNFRFHCSRRRVGVDQQTGEGIYWSPDPGNPEPDLVLAVECRPAGDRRRTELVRRVLDAGWMLRLSPVEVRSTNFNLEFETRAWLDCHGFPLVEIWRGIRKSDPHALLSVTNCIIPYNLCAGHAAAAESEVWPLYDEANARSLAGFVPKKIPVQMSQLERIDPNLVEGNVEVESFARLLDRVLRRASAGEPGGYSDFLLEKFVDLGSGRGLPVLAAHLLFPFRAVLGIELVDEVNNFARALAGSYAQHGFAEKAQAGTPSESLFELADLMEVDWSDASLVFVNNVTWPQSVVRTLACQALRLRQNAVVLSAQRFPNELDVLRGFDVRGEACITGWNDCEILFWAYRRR